MRRRLAAAAAATIGAAIASWGLLVFAGADLVNVVVMTAAIFVAVFYFSGRGQSAH